MSKPTSKEYYVYALCNPFKPFPKDEYWWKYDGVRFLFEFEPFYIGKGKNGRLNNHNGYEKTHKGYTIAKIESRGKEVVRIKIRENLTEIKAHQIEMKYITKIGRRNTNTGPLTNLTDGGEGTSGRIIKESSKEKCSISNKEHWENLSRKEKRLHSKRMSDMQQSIDKKKRKKIYKKRMNTIANRDSELTKLYSEEKSIRKLNWYKNLSEKEEKRLLKAMSKGQKLRQHLNPHSDETVSKISSSVKKNWDNLSEKEYKEKCNKMSQAKLNRTAKQKKSALIKKLTTLKNKGLLKNEWKLTRLLES